METEKKVCAKCGQILAPWLRNCPNCNAPVPQAAPVQVSDALELEEPSVAAESAVPAFPDLPIFPERMKANKILAGRTCTSCLREIELGDDVWNCQACGNTMHQICHEQTKLCGNGQCSSRPKAAVVQARQMAPAAAAAAGTVPCRFCGEAILKTAKLCKFCGEYQTDFDRAKAQKRLSAASGDDTLTSGEIVFGILCGLIACITAIVWMIQGKGKGWKLLVITIIAQLVFGLLRLGLRH